MNLCCTNILWCTNIHDFLSKFFCTTSWVGQEKNSTCPTRDTTRFHMDALVQDLERNFQFCVPNIKRRKEDTSSASVLTSKVRGNSTTTEVVEWGSHSTTSLLSNVRKRDLNTRLIHKCLCDERLKSKGGGSTRLTYTGLRGGLEHLKIETRLINERL